VLSADFASAAAPPNIQVLGVRSVSGCWKRETKALGFSVVLGLVFLAVQPVAISAPASSDASASLTFDDLVELSIEKKPPETLQQKLDRVLATPIIYNRPVPPVPIRPIDPVIGPVLRVGLWNIERGLQFSLIDQALKTPNKFINVVKTERPLTPLKLWLIQDQLDTLRGADVLILNEVDKGMGRTGYRDIARDLAASLGMNYTYGVEFVEVGGLDPHPSDRETADDNPRVSKISADAEPDPELYLGLQGNAILSRYPIERVNVLRLPVCHDWYAGEEQQTSFLEKGKRLAINTFLGEPIEREVRRGNRMALIADLRVPESPTGKVTVVATHLENRGKPSCRRKQMEAILKQIHDNPNPLILAGDFNTSGQDGAPTSIRHELKELSKNYSFWAKQLAFTLFTPMRLSNWAMLPYRAWRTFHDPTVLQIPMFAGNPEGRMFQELRRFTFADKNTFDFGGNADHTRTLRRGTLASSNERAFKGFAPTYATARTMGGLSELKLDWFFIKPVIVASDSSRKEYRFGPWFPYTMQQLNQAELQRLSDHSSMSVDISLQPLPVH
jgi:endonuclease/exonuclease/phosphatase family metal-dependent hydrolase